MSDVRITVVELKGIDTDTEFGLVRTIRELLERPGTVVLSEVVPPAPAAASAEAEPVAESEPAPAPVPMAAHARGPVRSQVEIEEIILDLLRLQPDIGMDQLAALAYGEGDKRARTKLTWTLKGLAQRGQVERLSATTWRVLAADERDDDADRDADGDHEDAEELEL
jgi:hypothetical protein